MNDLVEIENRSTIGRITCGWKKAALPLELVRRYWRDVHSPGIARRPGIYEYRHLQYDAVRADLVGELPNVLLQCPADQQLMWTSDVRYLDQAGLTRFGAVPSDPARTQLLGDIELIVDKSTTYLALGNNAWTFCDRTLDPAPQGPCRQPSFALFLRQRHGEAAFRDCLRQLATRWAALSGVMRLRLSLFEVPDMEAERKAGYPVKTHPLEMQYQAWIDLKVSDASVLAEMFAGSLRHDFASEVSALHVYPVPVTYTSVYRNRATLVGLRGYAAYDAIKSMQATNHEQIELLTWMYGEVVDGGPFA